MERWFPEKCLNIQNNAYNSTPYLVQEERLPTKLEHLSKLENKFFLREQFNYKIQFIIYSYHIKLIYF